MLYLYTILLFLFFCAPCILASAADETSDASITEVIHEQITPRTDRCIPMPCGAFTPRDNRLVRHTSVSSLLAESSQSQSDSPRTPIATPRNRGLIRHASISSLIELSGSRSQSGDSPRLDLLAIQKSPAMSSQISLAQALPSPTTAYITDMRLTRLIQELNRKYNGDTILTAALRNISVSTTKDPVLVNEGYKIFTSVTIEEPVAQQREQVYKLYNHTLSSSPAADRLLAWRAYQTAIMTAMNNRLQVWLPGIVTQAVNTLYVAYNDPMPTSFTREQIAFLHQYIVAYAYMLNEQERTDGDLFATIFTDQMTNYRRYQFSLEQQQSARPLVQSLLKPKAIGITDMQIANLIQEHESNGSNILTEVLRSISVATLQTPKQVHDAHTQLMSIIEQQKTIADSRQLALNRLHPQIAMRSECWQGYHLAIMMRLNTLLAEQIPNITTDHTKLYVAFMGRAPVTFTPEQAKHIIKYILIYAVMLSEQETSDPEAFEHTFKHELALLRLSQPHSPKITTRKRSGSSIGSFNSIRSLFKKGDGPSSSNS